MKKLFLSPHDDDEALFGAYTCLREQPHIVFVTDSYVQPARGETGCSAKERAEESRKSCEVLGCEHSRLGIPDNVDDVYEQIRDGLKQFDPEIVYAPMRQKGNPHHDLVNKAALELWPGRVIEYPTYTKQSLYTTGTIEVVPTEEEKQIKKKAMACHDSQLRVNAAHFEAVLGKSEWLVGQNKLNLGSGKRPKEGWTNVDMMPYPNTVQADITQGLPFDDNSFDEVFSEDFLEHLPQEKKVFVMNEIWRVLKPGGFMEHLVPNAGSRNDFGSPSHLSHWSLQQFEHFDIQSYRYLKDADYEGFKGAFLKVFAGLLSWDQDDNKYQALNVKYQAIK